MVNYFCTAGRGTEPFVVAELDALTDVENIKKIDGKIYFAAKDSKLGDLLNLKCIERLFIEAKTFPEFQLQTNKDVQNLGLDLASSSDWTTICNTFKKFLGFSRDVQNIEDKDLPSVDADEMPASKRRKVDETVSNNEKAITFRVSCRLSGRLARKFNHQIISKSLGWHIRNKLGWTVDMRNPFLEICVHIGSAGATAGIPVTRNPLSLRKYVTDFGLRSTVAWILAKLANIQQGNVVLDPMCGAATILLEASNSWPDAYYIGIDSSSCQIERAQHNMSKDHSRHTHLLCGDALHLPIMTSSIDAIVCDMPFGNKFLTVERVKEMIPGLLGEFDRVLRQSGTAVLLIGSRLKDELVDQASKLVSNQKSDKLHSSSGNQCQYVQTAVNESVLSGSSLELLRTEESTWKLKGTHYLKLGETHSFACVFEKK